MIICAEIKYVQLLRMSMINKLENINWVRNGRDTELNRELSTLLYGLRKSRGVCWNEN